MLKLKLESFGHLMQRDNSLEKTLMLGTGEGKRRKAQQRVRWLDSITDSADRNLSKLLEIVKDKGVLWCIPWYCRVGHAEQLNSSNKRKCEHLWLAQFHCGRQRHSEIILLD